MQVVEGLVMGGICSRSQDNVNFRNKVLGEGPNGIINYGPLPSEKAFISVACRRSLLLIFFYYYSVFPSDRVHALRQAFQEVDLDGTGKIKWEEFAAMGRVRRHLKLLPGHIPEQLIDFNSESILPARCCMAKDGIRPPSRENLTPWMNIMNPPSAVRF